MKMGWRTNLLWICDYYYHDHFHRPRWRYKIFQTIFQKHHNPMYTALKLFVVKFK
jgi:hypothetical protein